MSKFKYKLIDPAGRQISASNFWGSVGLTESYSGRLDDEDAAVVAMRKLLDGSKRDQLDERERLLARSLVAGWLTNKRNALTKVVVFSVPLPASVRMLGQIGFLDRTAGGVVNIAAGVAGFAASVFLADFWATLWLEDDDVVAATGLAVAAGVEVGSWLVPDALVEKIDTEFGEPGTPVARAKFEAGLILEMSRLCRLRCVLGRLGFEPETLVQMSNRLDQRLFTLFLLNSRQLEGLILSGASEASAVVAAHAAIALTISELEDSHSLLQTWERGIKQLSDPLRVSEAMNTLDAARRNLDNESRQIERQICRSLASSAATETIDLVTTPVALSFELMAMIAKGMAQVTPEGHFRTVFESATKGMDLAKTASKATPDVFANAIDGGINAEFWLRKQVAQFWPIGSKAQKNDDKS